MLDEKTMVSDALAGVNGELVRYGEMISQTENQELKQEIRNLKSSIEAVKYSEKEVTNVDLLRRISQLEKIILGKEQQ